MSLKVKLTSLITTFVLLVSLLTVGVFAVKNTTFNVGGNIEFNVKGIEASIKMISNTGFKTTNGKAIGTEVLTDITLNNDMSAQDVEDAFAPWSGLELEFIEGATTATIVLEIENTVQSEEEGVVPDNYLDISAIASATTKNNAKIKVQNNAGGVTALLQQGDKATFTITFSVIDDEYSASLNGFSVNFDIQKKVLADFPKVESIEDKEDLLDQYEFSGFSTEAPYTVTIGAKGARSMNYTTTLSDAIVVPDYVNKDGIVYAVTKLSSGAFGHGGPQKTFDYTSLILPKTLTSFSSFCIFTTNLVSIEIPYGVTSIVGYAFQDSGLTSITIPDSVTSIGDYAFSDCSSLTSITIPDSITTIGDSAFSDCSSLNSVIIPNSVIKLTNHSFDCRYLTSIKVESGNKVYDSRNYCNAIIETATNKLIIGCKNTIIPNTVEAIGDRAFSDCSSLTSITIPDSVTSIEYYAFGGCSELSSITIPDSVTSIGDWAFSYSGLTDVYYRGTEEQWNALLANVGAYNTELTGATIHYEHTGE